MLGARIVGVIANAAEVADLVSGARTATERLLENIVGLDDGSASAPSRLPGWTRGHVLTHLARNADAQVRLLEGALRAIRVEQYEGGALGRQREIDEGARRPVQVLVNDVTAAAERLSNLWDRMTPEAWDRPAAGLIAGERPAWATVWSRWGEIEYHHVDLGIGFRPEDWSSTFVERVLTRTLPRFTEQLKEPMALRITVTDEASSVAYGPHDAATEMSGPSYALVAWVTGRAGPWLDLIHCQRAGKRVPLPNVRAWA